MSTKILDRTIAVNRISSLDTAGHFGLALQPYDSVVQDSDTAVPVIPSVANSAGNQRLLNDSGQATTNGTPADTPLKNENAGQKTESSVMLKSNREPVDEAHIDTYSNWTLTPDQTFTHGLYTLKPDAVNAADNSSDESGQSSAQPAITGIFDDYGNKLRNVTADNTPTLTGSAEPGTIVEVFANGISIGKTPVNADGSWAFTPNDPLANGHYNFTVMSVDTTGQPGEQSPPFQLVIEAPANTNLGVSLDDVLSDGANNLFDDNDTPKLMVTEGKEAGVEPQGLLGTEDPDKWAAQGQVTVAGMTHEAYSHSTLDTEWLAQQWPLY